MCIFGCSYLYLFLYSLNFWQNKDLRYSNGEVTGVLSVSSPPGTGEWRLFPYRELGKVYAMFMYVYPGKSLPLVSKKKNLFFLFHWVFFFMVHHFQKYIFKYMYFMCIHNCMNLLWDHYTNIQICILICSKCRVHIIWLCDLLFFLFHTHFEQKSSGKHFQLYYTCNILDNMNFKTVSNGLLKGK